LRALVTGAASGIGAAVTARLAGAGLEVVTLDRQPGCHLLVDVAVDDLPDLSGIDVCVLSHGITNTIAPAHEMTMEQWRRDLDVNLTGSFRVVQAVLPGMRERRYGRIVVLSSGAAVAGLPRQIAYAASKAGLLGMVKTLAAENAGLGITANAILPGMIATEKVKAMPAEVMARVIEMQPSGRLGEPEEVAGLVLYLVSDEAGYVTGQDILIDGGMALNTFTLTRRGR
jgi:NAD(P)-dependent dehydrogenase (short-subunit alcohol dehydrogenase family)